MNKSIVDNILDEDFIELVSKSISINELALKMGYKNAPGLNTRNKINNRIESVNISLKDRPSLSLEERKSKQLKDLKNYKKIGDIGENYFKYECAKFDILNAQVLGDNSPYEFIIELNKKLYRVQVKTSTVDTGSTIIFSTSQSQLVNGVYRSGKYEKGSFEFYYLFSTTREEGYLVPFSEAGVSSTSIRYKESYNNQSKNIKMAEDYLFENIIKDLL
jgi:hypothetical protein